jgi:hypothetical protein
MRHFLRRQKNVESPHSCTIVEVGVDEIPSILNFDSQIFQVEDVESPNSRTVVEVGSDEIPLTLGVDSLVLCSHATKVNPFQMIFDMNEILIATRFNKGSCIVILRPRLKEFLEKILVQFQVYIWSTTQCHNTPYKNMFNGQYSAIFWSRLMTFVGRINICWGLFSLEKSSLIQIQCSPFC